jgi:glycosyltransferase involved in cell wall biosynthesis
MDSYGNFSNGTTATARRFATYLRERGHTVRILAASSEQANNEKDYYPVSPFKLPIFQPLVDKQGFTFAKADKEVIYNALKGADVVHLFLPFPLENTARKIAGILNIPVTAAFHLQPENVTYTLYLGKNKFINNEFYIYLYKHFYKYVKHVHCPSKMIEDQLVSHGYSTNVTHVISNGVVPNFVRQKAEKPSELKDKFVILMIGRLSREKRQDLIIKAVGNSKYNAKIQLILCGQGPNKIILKELSNSKLVNPLIVNFVSQEDLIKIINYSDLYVHSSDAEIEAIACIEAFKCGLVPVISNSPISATKQFALNDKNLFKKGDFKSLQEKIEYWIEHPQEKEKLSNEYVEYANQYKIENEVVKLENIFIQAVEENAKGESIPKINKSKRQIKKDLKFEREFKKSLDLKNI